MNKEVLSGIEENLEKWLPRVIVIGILGLVAMAAV